MKSASYPSAALPHDCAIVALDPVAAGEALHRLAAGANEAHDRWLLAHCDDGVIWGRFALGSWQLSSAAYPKVSPQLVERRLQQLRTFGHHGELLLWRSGGSLRGRRLRDDPHPSTPDFLRAMDEVRILLGDRQVEPARGGFTLAGDANGSCHAVPLDCAEDDFQDGRHPLRMRLRHYFARDAESGIVRIAATRLVDVWNAEAR